MSTIDQPVSPNLGYDGFLSYSSSDRRSAVQLQRFLESLSLKRETGPSAPLRIYLDRTDIRGGELAPEINAALGRSRTLILLCSPAAAVSEWVGREVEQFLAGRADSRIALVLVEGTPETAVPRALRGRELRFHDLRSGRRFGAYWGNGYIEALRLFAFVSGEDLRAVLDWGKLRRRRRWWSTFAAVVAAAVGTLLFPVQVWQVMALKDRWGTALQVVACQVGGGGLEVGRRFRANGPQGFRNYIGVGPIRSDSGPPGSGSIHPDSERFLDAFRFANRLLPLSRVDWSIRERAARALGDSTWSALTRDTTSGDGEPWLGEPKAGRFIAIRPQKPTEADRAAADSMDAELPEQAIPRRGMVVTYADGTIRFALVDGLAPVWSDLTPTGAPRSPAQGVAVAWAFDGLVWLGMAAPRDQLQPRYGYTRGGLWSTTDTGRSWLTVPGAESVASLAIDGGNPAMVQFSESPHELWQGSILRPYSTAVFRADGKAGLLPAPSMPPYGSQSEVEVCGFDSTGAPVVRVDERLYWRHRRMLGAGLLRTE